MQAELLLFGRARLKYGDQKTVLLLRKNVLLLIYLAYKKTWVSRDELIDLLYDSDELGARNGLRLLIHRSRHLAWAKNLEIEADLLRLQLPTDVDRFRQAIEQGHTQEALAIYQGEFLAGLVTESTNFESWLENERQNLQQIWSRQALQLANSLQTNGKNHETNALLEKVWLANPLAEDILQAYLRTIDQSDQALAVFNKFSKILKQELNLEPLPETKELVQSIHQRVISVDQSQKLWPNKKPDFIGREQELALVRKSNKSLVLIAGLPGVGKTRLLENFDNTIWLRCQEGLDNVPYLPVVQCLRKLLPTLSNLGNFRHDLARLIPDLGSISSIDPQIAKSRLLEALNFVFTSLGKAVIFDDLQWADSSTLELLTYMTQSAQIKLFGTYRTGEINTSFNEILHGLQAKGLVDIVDLKVFDQKETFALAKSLFSRLSDDYTAWIFKQSGGNPYFIEQIVKNLLEQNISFAEIDRLAVPTTISGLVKRLLSRLSNQAQRVITAASVLGENLTVDMLSPISGLSDWAVIEAITEAENAGIITESRFIHDLTRQAIKNELSLSLKKLIHANIAEKLHDKLGLVELAEHYLAADQINKAFDTWLEAANDLLNRQFGEQAIEILQRVEKIPLSKENLLIILVGKISIFIGLNRLNEANDLLNSISPDEIENLAVKFVYLKAKAGIMLSFGQQKDALSVIEQAKRLISVLLTEQLELSQKYSILYRYIRFGILHEETQLLLDTGRFQEVIEFLIPELEKIKSKLNYRAQDVRLFAQYHSLQIKVMIAYAHLGRDSEVLTIMKDNIDSLKRANDQNGLRLALYNQAVYLTAHSEFEKAIDVAKQVLDLREHDRSSAIFSRLNALLAESYERKGRLDESLHYADVAVATAQDVRSRIIAFEKLISVLYSSKNTKEATIKIDNLLSEFLHHEDMQSRSKFYSVVYNFGSDDQVRLIEKEFDALKKEQIPTVVWSELQESRQERLKKLTLS